MLWLILVIVFILLAYSVYKVANQRNQRLKFINRKYLDHAKDLLEMYKSDPVRACLQIDSLFGKIMAELGIHGTVGEQLKKSSKLFDKDLYNNIWEAHKVRNRIAHEGHDERLEIDARNTRFVFEKALKTLGLEL